MTGDGNGRKIRVVIADDSQTVRAVLLRMLENAGCSVVRAAADGEEAIRAVLETSPDVVLLDLDMPVLDGAEATRIIMERSPRPIVILTSRADPKVFREAARALDAGALEVVPKPGTPDEWVALQERLARLLAEATGIGRGGRGTVSVGQGGVVIPRSFAPKVIAVGASTGGPTALRDLLKGLGSPAPLPVLIVQHMAAGFEAGLAEWLALETGQPVHLAEDGTPIGAPEIRIAPAGVHLRVGADWRVTLDADRGPRNGHRPSVDELFLSCAELDPPAVVAVLLTGMGQDGVEGLSVLRDRGALTIAQDPETCAVPGMPETAIRAGAAELILAPGRAGELVRGLAREGRTP